MIIPQDRVSGLTLERLKEVLSYDPETGVFTWRVKPSKRVRAGAVAGSIDDEGYRRIKVDGRLYLASRLAWFYMTGEWPAEEIDHRNTVRGDDRWDNLREATRGQNQQNSSKRRDNTSGVKGVSWENRAGKWHARIHINGCRIHLGYFSDLDVAAAAYAAASERLHGEYGRTA